MSFTLPVSRRGCARVRGIPVGAVPGPARTTRKSNPDGITISMRLTRWSLRRLPCRQTMSTHSFVNAWGVAFNPQGFRVDPRTNHTGLAHFV